MARLRTVTKSMLPEYSEAEIKSESIFETKSHRALKVMVRNLELPRSAKRKHKNMLR